MNLNDSSISSNSADSDFVLHKKRKSLSKKKSCTGKNYTKNILTCMIKSLDVLGYQEVYLDDGFCLEQIQKRNSASLKIIYKILFHPFMNKFNKDRFELIASNILLQNSKIQKKAYHLLLLREAFSFQPTTSLQQFRNWMGKKSKSNSYRNSPNLQIFEYQSSTIYLLTVFGKIIEVQTNLSEDSEENRQSTYEFQKNVNNKQKQKYKKQKKSNQVFKPSIKDLSVKLNTILYDQETIYEIYASIKSVILATEKHIIEKLNLKQGVSYLRLFCSEVVSLCLFKIKNQEKITILNLETWVKQFERKTIESLCQSADCVLYPFPKLFENQKQKKSSYPLVQKILKSTFSPIILTQSFEISKGP